MLCIIAASAGLALGGALVPSSAAAASTTPSPPFTECPAVNHDTSCQVLVVLQSDGSLAILTDPSQPAYDNGDDDSLIGFLNQSSEPVSSITLAGPTGTFGFDGDGICTYNVGTCNPADSTGYGGPNVTFSDIDPVHQAYGTVNFDPVVPPGGSAYFSLELEATTPEFSTSPLTLTGGSTGPAGSPGSTSSTGSTGSGSGSGSSGGSGSGSAGPVTAAAGSGSSSGGSSGGGLATLSAVIDFPVSGVLATLSDADSSDTAKMLKATIEWGDGTESAGVVAGGDGRFTVSGRHDYRKVGQDYVKVIVTKRGSIIGATTVLLADVGAPSYVALGDAFTTGAGITPYYEPKGICERSKQAFPAQVAVDGLTFRGLALHYPGSFGFLACSAATVADVEAYQMASSNVTGAANFSPLSAATDLVSVTAGAEDLDLGKILADCYSSRDCAAEPFRAGKTLAAWTSAQLPLIRKRLVALFKKIHLQAPNAKIVALGYPQLLPATAAQQACSELRPKGSAGLGAADQRFIRSITTSLDQEIAAAAAGSKEASYLSVEGLFDGHEACGASGAWVTTSRPVVRSGKVEAASIDFHLTSKGEQAYARLLDRFLAGWLHAQRAPATPVPATPAASTSEGS